MKTRRWTDERSGNEWEISLLGGIATGARGGDHLPEVRPRKISFRRENQHYSIEYDPGLKSLEEHSDLELQALLEQARERA